MKVCKQCQTTQAELRTQGREIFFMLFIYSLLQILHFWGIIAITLILEILFFSTNLDFLGEVTNAIYEGIFYYYLK